jgi:hypothetical protein
VAELLSFSDSRQNRTRTLIGLRLWCVGILLLTWTPITWGALFGITGGHDVASELFELDPSTGAVLSRLGSTGVMNASGFAIHPITGDFYVHENRLPFDNGGLYRVDRLTLVPTLLGETHMSVDDLAFSPDGTLHGWMAFHDGEKFDFLTAYELVTFDLTTGAGTIKGNSDLLTFQNGLGFDANGDLFIKGIEETLVPGSPSLFHSEIYQIDPDTGARTHVVRLHDATAGIGGDIYPNDVLTFDGVDHAFTIQRNYDSSDPLIAPVFLSSFLQRIDLNTGAVTTLGSNLGLEFIGLAFSNTPAAVPEPSAFLVLISACLAACGYRQKFRNGSLSVGSQKGPAIGASKGASWTRKA